MKTDQEKLGIFLKTEREKVDLSVDDMARSLKITPESIRYIETGDTESIGLGDIFVKSYIKAYLLELGHSPDDTLQRFSVFDNDDSTKLSHTGTTTIFYNVYIQVGALLLFIIFLLFGISIMKPSPQKKPEVKIEKVNDDITNLKKDEKFSNYSEEIN